MDFTGERYVPGVGGSIALEHEHRYRFCLDIVKGCRVLDIACGEGFGSAIMAQQAAEVWGVDIDAEAVIHADQTYRRENLRYLQGSCTEIPLPDASVDVVVSFETIEHHDEHEAMMEEIRRVLRPGGALVISSPDKRIYSEARNFRNEYHVKELYAEEFSALLRSRFAHVSMFGQRVIYGSALLLQEGLGRIRSYGVDSTEPVSGLQDPMFHVAIASDDPSWAERGHGGVLEDTVYRSEAVLERTLAGTKQADDLRLRIDDLRLERDRLRGELQILHNQLYYSATIWRRLAFHRSGRPRGWLRSLLLKDKNVGTPRALTRRILLKKSGQVRPIFAQWYHQSNSADSPITDYVAFLRKEIASGGLASARTLHIVTTTHTEFVGESIAAALAPTRLNVTRSTRMPRSFESDLYIVVAPQMFETLPPASRTIMVQMEQVRASNWVDDAYMTRLMNSIAVLDYSRDNITALIERGMPLKQIYYMPIRPLRPAERSTDKRDIDVLFYGAIASDRRRRYISALSERVNLRVETDLFGPELRALLDRTKVVVNVHFYENALLETTRISEALTHGARVISEEAADQADRADFDGLVDFVPEGEVEAFVDRVESALAAWTAPVALLEDDGLAGMPFHMLRALHGSGVLSLEELEEACRGVTLPANRMILAMPEQAARYNFARANQLPGTALFHGLRDIDGWKGCAQSYKFMAKLALADGLPQLMVYEDDASFEHDIAERLDVIERYLEKRGADWDVFSGLLSDLHSDAEITRIECFESEEFIELDSLIGMVFGIYNRSALELLAAFEFGGIDIMKHTIDRYLEAMRPRCVTTLPPIANHNEDLNSTIWGVNNSATSKRIKNSLARLQSKRMASMQKTDAGKIALRASPDDEHA